MYTRHALTALALITALAASAAAEPTSTAKPTNSEARPPPAETPPDRSAVSKLLIYGKTPGAPSEGKLFVVFTLHAVTLVSLGTGAYLLVNHRSETDELAKAQARGCSTPAGCSAQAERAGDLSLQATLASGAFALGSLALLGSITTAFTWDNDADAVKIGLTPTGAWASVSF